MTTHLQTTPLSSLFLAQTATGLKAVIAFAKRRWQVWRNRREAEALLRWDEHALKDIGLTPMDVQLAMALPGSVDASTRLRILAVERRSAERAQARERAQKGPEIERRNGKAANTEASVAATGR